MPLYVNLEFDGERVWHSITDAKITNYVGSRAKIARRIYFAWKKLRAQCNTYQYRFTARFNIPYNKNTPTFDTLAAMGILNPSSYDFLEENQMYRPYYDFVVNCHRNLIFIQQQAMAGNYGHNGYWNIGMMQQMMASQNDDQMFATYRNLQNGRD